MLTQRHNFNLRLRNQLIIAPRYFKIGEHYYFVHIEKLCRYVHIFYSFGAYKENYCNVHYHSCLKLYSNTKGLYFNFSYWVSESKKTKIRVYICD